MKLFVKRGLLFSLPLVVWVAAIVVIDPFDYFNWFHAVPEHVKVENAAQLNSLTYNMLQELHNPCENLIIGDSRAESLPLDEIEKATGEHYFKLAAYALKLNESIDLFYYANAIKPLKHTVFTINFNEYNEYAYADRVHSVEQTIHNPFIYLFDRNVAQAAYYVVKSSLDKKKSINSRPQMAESDFWNYIVTVRAREHYERYKYPAALHERFEEMIAFAKARGIDVTFIIVPHHADFQRRVKEFGLADDYLRFKMDMSQLGTRVIDYDYDNEITENRADFRDPIHYNAQIGKLIVNEVFRGPLIEGKLLDTTTAKERSAFSFN